MQQRPRAVCKRRDTPDPQSTFAQTGANQTSGGGYTGTAESRFAPGSKVKDHEQHQNAMGARGLNLTPTFRRLPTTLDFGNNTMERVQRLMQFTLWRNLGIDSSPYHAPMTCTITAFLDAVDAGNNALIAQLCGDIITIDSTISEEYQGDYEIMEAPINLPTQDGSGSSSASGGADQTQGATIDLKLLQYLPGAFNDPVTTFIAVRAAINRGGLSPIAAVLSNGKQQLAGTFKNNPTNTNGQFTSGNPLSQSGNTSTILLAACSLKFGDGVVSYAATSVNAGALGKFYVYCRDSLFAGGTITLLVTSNVADLTGFNDIICFGVITLLAGGGATGTGGGGGGSGGVKLPQ